MEKQFIQLKNEKLAYVEFESDKDVMVLIHGNMSSSLHFTPLFEELKKAYHLIALDLRGFGDSTYNHRFDSLHELAEDIKEFFDCKGIQKAHLVGWSTGTGIALDFAATYPEHVLSLFSIEGVGHRGYPIYKKDEQGQQLIGEVYKSKEEMAKDPVQVANMQAVFETNNTAVMEIVWNASIYTVNKPTKEDNDLWISETMKQRNLIDIDWSLASLNLSDSSNGYSDGNNKITQVTCPCAFTHGDKDLVVPLVMPMETVKAIGAHAKLIQYENCGHSPLVDVADQLIQDILATCK